MSKSPQTKRNLVLGICAVAIFLLCWRANEGAGQNAQHAARIHGAWTEVFREATGDDFPSIDAARVLQTLPNEGGPPQEWKPHLWKFTKDTFEEGRGTKESPVAKYIYELDVGGKAGTIDLIRVDKDEKLKHGLYWYADDFLLIAWNPPGEPRPESLMTQPKSKTTMVILRKGVLK